MPGSDAQAGHREAQDPGQQPEAGLVRVPADRRRGDAEPEDAIRRYADDLLARCLWLEADQKDGIPPVLPNREHYRRRQASSLSEATRNFWTKMIARMATRGEKSIPHPRRGSQR